MLYIRNVISEGALHFAVQVCVLFNELRRKSVEQTEQVMRYQHLTIAANARARIPIVGIDSF